MEKQPKMKQEFYFRDTQLAKSPRQLFLLYIMQFLELEIICSKNEMSQMSQKIHIQFVPLFPLLYFLLCPINSSSSLDTQPSYPSCHLIYQLHSVSLIILTSSSLQINLIIAMMFPGIKKRAHSLKSNICPISSNLRNMAPRLKCQHFFQSSIIHGIKWTEYFK